MIKPRESARVLSSHNVQGFGKGLEAVRCTKLPQCAEIREKIGPQESIVHILTLHLCKILFSRLEPVTT